MFHRQLRLVVFDMDGVLADTPSSWVYVHQAFGVNNRTNLDLYLQCEIDYDEFMRRDIRTWGKVQASRVKTILDLVPLMRGAQDTIRALKAKGYRTAIVSAGIWTLAERVQQQLGIDRILANDLVVDPSGFLTGEGRKLVELKDKLPALKFLAALEGIPRSSMIYVGDSEFDTHVFKRVGKSIAFNTSSDEVKDSADVWVCGNDLTRLLTHVP